MMRSRYRTLVLLVLMHSLMLGASDYYVDADASCRGADGSMMRPWPMLDLAISHDLLPGDIVHIKAGDYPSEGIVLMQSGSQEQPIVFQGYREITGDIQQTTPLSVWPSAPDLPLFRGSNPGENVGIDLNGQDHIVIRNIALRDYRVGVRNMRAPNARSENIRLEYLIGKRFGEQNNNGYSGWGLLLDDNGWTVQSCTIIDAGAEAIGVYGNENKIVDCLVINREDANATDYYIIVSGDRNQVHRCEIYRDASIRSHSGHGIGVKNGKENTFRECMASNTNKGLYVSGPECSDNYFEHCEAQGDVGIVLRDGAHLNEFKKCHVRDAEIAVRFMESVEYGWQGTAARWNSFFDCDFAHSKTMIELRSSNSTAEVLDNRFARCQFNDAHRLFDIQTIARANVLEDCRFMDVATGGVAWYARAEQTAGFAIRAGRVHQRGLGLEAVDSARSALGEPELFVGRLDCGDLHWRNYLPLWQYHPLLSASYRADDSPLHHVAEDIESRKLRSRYSVKPSLIENALPASISIRTQSGLPVGYAYLLDGSREVIWSGEGPINRIDISPGMPASEYRLILFTGEHCEQHHVEIF